MGANTIYKGRIHQSFVVVFKTVSKRFSNGVSATREVELNSSLSSLSVFGSIRLDVIVNFRYVGA